MYVIGLTGGIGSGKSSVASLFMEYQIEIIDADAIARTVVEPCSPALQQIIDRHGKQILQQNGKLDRAQLRNIVFNNPTEKFWLETLLHPLIEKEAEWQIQNARGLYCIYMAPLLLEKKATAMIDRILVVDVPLEVQLERASMRDGCTEEAIQKMIDSQFNREQRLQHADDVVENSGTLEETREQVAKLHEQYVNYGRLNKTSVIPPVKP